MAACLLQKRKITTVIRNNDLQNSSSGNPGDDSQKDSDLHTLPFLSFAASNPSQSPSSPTSQGTVSADLVSESSPESISFLSQLIF